MCIKLSSGEEIIGKQIESLSDDLRMSHLHVLVIQPTKQGIDVSFIPWAFGAGSNEMTINQSHVTSMYEPGSDLANGFLSQISGIQIAKHL